MITLKHRATKAVQDITRPKLYYRTETDIYAMIRYVMEGEGCIYSNCRGILYNPENVSQMAREMLRVQEVYKKCSGVRIRRDFVTVTWDELPNENRENAIKEMAEYFADVYYWSGFQVVFGVFADKGQYYIRYAINTVNYHDGSKYQGGQSTWEQGMSFLGDILAMVNAKGGSVDYNGLEYF